MDTISLVPHGKTVFIIFFIRKNLFRQTENYRAFLLELKKKWDEEFGKTGGFQVGRIHTDYERAEIAAVQEIFGKDKARGCLFHYVKAVLLYLRKNCPLIFQLYSQGKKEKDPFWKLVKMKNLCYNIILIDPKNFGPSFVAK